MNRLITIQPAVQPGYGSNDGSLTSNGQPSSGVPKLTNKSLGNRSQVVVARVNRLPVVLGQGGFFGAATTWA